MSAPEPPAGQPGLEPVPESGPGATRGRRRRRTPVLLALLVALGLVTLALVTPQALSSPRGTPAVPGADLSAVVVYPELGREHTSAEVDYPMRPPAGGPHDPRWLDCGVYDSPVRDENAVHDLEHGAVWVTYDPDLADDDVARLAALLPANGLMSPYPDLAAPVVVTVWQHQLSLTGADDPRLILFLAAFSDGHTAPEPFASCQGGITDGDGGTTAQV